MPKRPPTARISGLLNPNRAMRTLRAMDISIINGTMLPQIVILSVIFLEEIPDLVEIGGLILVGLGALMVQLNQIKHISDNESVD